MMRPLLLVFLFVLAGQCKAEEQHLTNADVNFFFDSINFKNSAWEFKLSPNTQGMTWRTIKDKSDTVGACESGQVLTVPSPASLEIYGKDIRLFLQPRGLITYDAHLDISPDAGASKEVETRSGLIKAQLYPQEGIILSFVEEPFQSRSININHGDIEYFFDSITLEHGQTRFEPSRNAVGLSWEIKTDKTDVTGTCKYKQVLNVPPSATLVITRKDFDLGFLPNGADLGSFTVRASIKHETGDKESIEYREATLLKVNGDGTYSILIGID